MILEINSRINYADDWDTTRNKMMMCTYESHVKTIVIWCSYVFLQVSFFSKLHPNLQRMHLVHIPASNLTATFGESYPHVFRRNLRRATGGSEPSSSTVPVRIPERLEGLVGCDTPKGSNCRYGFLVKAQDCFKFVLFCLRPISA